MVFSRKKSALADLVEKVQPSVCRQTVPGYPEQWAHRDTQAQGLVRSLQDSGLVSWERSVSPNAEQPFVITVTRDAGEWSSREKELFPNVSPRLRCTHWKRRRKPVPHLGSALPWAGISKDILTSVNIQPCIHLHSNAQSGFGILKVVDLAEGEARSWHRWPTQWFNTSCPQQEKKLTHLSSFAHAFPQNFRDYGIITATPCPTSPTTPHVLCWSLVRVWFSPS